MSDSTFEQLWKRLLVYYPELPLPLAQEFINTAYSQALAEYKWSGLRGQGEFFIPAPYSDGTVDVSQGSATVNGNSTTFTLSMIGRQLIIGGKAPFYTIIGTTPSTLTLDRVYGGESLTATPYVVQLVYITAPSDFSSWLSIVDVERNWKLHTNWTSEQLDAFDAQRKHAVNTFILASTSPNTTSVVGQAGLPRFELYPRAQGPKSYPFKYLKKLPLLSAPSDTPLFPIRGDVLRHGALAELALWPGTKQLKNPYFDMQQYATHFERFKKELIPCEKEDQELAQTMITYADQMPFAPLDAQWIQEHGGWPYI